MFKSIASIAVAAATTLVAIAPAEAASNHNHHLVLANTIADANVSLHINPAICWEEDSFGFYISSMQAMVICQENKTSPDVQVDWTEEDYDTLRHEAQHLIQDCMVGSRTDNQLHPVYKNPVGFAQDVLTDASIKDIVSAYSGLSEADIILEIEAFAVAALNDPIDQVEDIQNFCF